MMSRLIIVAVLALAVTSAAKKKPNKRTFKAGLGALQDQIDELEKEVAELMETKTGDEELNNGCNVHFYFHDDGHHVTSTDADAVNVRVSMDHEHGGMSHGDHMEHLHEAHCEMHTTDPTVHGHVHMVQQHGDPHARFHVMFPNVGQSSIEYELHVHEYGDMTSGCSSIGGHFMLGSVDVGDLGEVSSLPDSSINSWINDTQVALVGPHSIVGRSLMLHDDDGSPVGCCVIGWSAEMDTTAHLGTAGSTHEHSPGATHEHGHAHKETHEHGPDHAHHGHHE